MPYRGRIEAVSWPFRGRIEDIPNVPFFKGNKFSQ